MKKQLLFSLFTYLLLTLTTFAQVGFTCSNAIEIPSLPYQTIDNTANYGDLTDVSQGASCGAFPSSTNYLVGNEVFYTYVADFTGYLSISMLPMGETSTNSAVFVYENCSNVGAACTGGMANASTDLRELNILVFQGNTYKIVVSSSAATQTVAYKLTLEKNQCSPKPNNLGVTNINSTGANLTWANTGNYSSWQIAVQEAGNTIPLGAGESTSSVTNYIKTGLTPNTSYQFWVRSECVPGSATFSQWAGPYVFQTTLCENANKCTYTFLLSDSGNNGWNGATMDVWQNGNLIKTIGQYFNSGSSLPQSVALCKNAPFEIIWNVAGTAPEEVGLTVKNPFGQTLYIKQATDEPGETIFLGDEVQCVTPICQTAPSNMSYTQLTGTSIIADWTSADAESWDIYVVSVNAIEPVAGTIPTYSNVQKPFTIEGLSENSSYKYYVRSNCSSYIKSAWSNATNFTLATTCFKPNNMFVENITTTSAKVNWYVGSSTDNTWEILLIPSATQNAPTTTPSANPTLENGAVIVPVSGSNSFKNLTNLNQGTIYVCYIRTICSATNKSDWSEPFIFNTIICENAFQCNYKFLLSNESNNSWNYGEMQVRQNGIVVATLGTGGINNPNGITVALCNNVPFDLYWNEEGYMPSEIGVKIINPFLDLVYSKLPGEGTSFSTLFSSTASCVPPSCLTPSNLLVGNVNQTSAQLSWSEAGSATQWEVYVAEEGDLAPVNSTSLNGNTAPYFLANTNSNFTITGLNASTNYTYYVRSICSTTDIGFWSLLFPQTFSTTPHNDECAFAAPIPVNPTPELVQVASGSTLGSTASAFTSICSTTENGDVWFNFVATNNFHLIKLINILGSETNLVLTLYSGTNCSAMTQVTCNFLWYNNNTSLFNNLTVGEMYKVRVSRSTTDADAYATFDIAVTTPNLTNDECSNAITIPVGNQEVTANPTSGTVTGATASTQVTSCAGIANDDVWFKFTAIGTKQVIAISNIVGTSTDLHFAVYEGADCEDLNLISCFDYFVGTLTTLNIGQEYTIKVWSDSEFLDDVTFDITVTSFYPPLVGTTTGFTVSELVTDVLVNNPCVTISNITSGTGTTSLTNGIGYFSNTNPNFPINNGLVLSTGNAAKVGGPNDSNLSDGGAGGDSDLETLIQAATGSSITTNNATKLEFDFISQNEFMSFNFIFASEEYGTFQCQYADAFAFLLTDLTTGITTNLAVVPGTTTPISVVTIRDNANNLSCTSENIGFFDTYYSFGAAGNAPIDFNGQTTLMSASSAIVANNPYHIKMVIADRGDTAYDSAVFIQGGSFSSGPPSCSDKVELVAFIDSNNDGIKQVTESSFTYGSFVYQLNEIGDLSNISSPIGNYTVYDENPLNSYDFTYSIHPEYATYFSAGTTSHSNITIPVGSGTQTLYFPITQTQGYNDVTVSVSPIGQPVAGFSYSNQIVYTNLGTTSTSGTITYTKDAAVTVSSLQSGVTLTPTGLTYNFTNLAPFETRSFTISIDVPAIPAVNIDDVLSSSVQISAPADDINVNNNTFEISQIVVASYDPNDKMEAHGDKLDINTFNQDDYLFYTIRFQNTGTANAINVRIEDVLDTQLDEESLRMVSASHNYVMERVGNQLVWRFDYIYLPSQLANEELSNGYLTFKIKVKPGFEVGDVIPNFAEIYFDTNPAIVTNTFLSEFEVNLGTQTFSTNNILLYPNPTNSILHVSLQDTNESLSKIVIYDVIGKVIKTIAGNSVQQTAINIGNFAKGVYLIEIITDTDLKQTRKFIVN